MQKYDWETIPMHVLKNNIKYISGLIVFIIYQFEDYWNTMKLSCRPLTLNSYKAFLKSKSRSGKNLSAAFSTKYLKKKICYIYYLTIFHCLVVFNLWDIGQHTVASRPKMIVVNCYECSEMSPKWSRERIFLK